MSRESNGLSPPGLGLPAWIYWLGTTKSPQESFEKAMELAQKALAMDDSIASAHGLLSHLYSLKREYDKAIAEGERAVALDPGGANAHDVLCHESDLRRPVGGSHSMFQKAIRLNPFGSILYLY